MPITLGHFKRFKTASLVSLCELYRVYIVEYVCAVAIVRVAFVNQQRRVDELVEKDER
jgi:hypothetical protein